MIFVALVAKYMQILSYLVQACFWFFSSQNTCVASQFCFFFCDNGDFLDEGFITALFSLEWLAGAFLHLHECHFHMVRNVIAKLKKYVLGFLTSSLLFVQCRRQKQ